MASRGYVLHTSFSGTFMVLIYSILWRDPENCSNDRYFCNCNVQGFSIKNKHEISYSNIHSTIHPVLHSPTILIRSLPAILDKCYMSQAYCINHVLVTKTLRSEPIPVTQSELNDLGLPKGFA